MSAPVKPASPPKTARPTMQLHPLASSSKQTVEHQEQTLTYRHVLSDSALTPLNPLRVICLIDIDAAYAQFEMARLGIDRSLPVGVQQWSSLIAINYPARKFDISRHDSAEEARKKCPDLICVHVATYKEGEQEAGYYDNAKPETHKVSLEHYRRESVKILKIFEQYCPTIEKASIDEAYMDFTVPVREKLLERYPELRAPPDDSPLGLDTPLPPAPAVSFDNLGHLVPIAPIETDLEDVQDAANLFSLPSTDDVPSWEAVAISIGAELVHQCRMAVKEELTYTCSAGVARNKTLAKLCAGWNKPDAQTVLRSTAIAGFLRPLSFQKIRFLGGKLGIAIAEQYDAQSVGDLWTVSLEEFQDKFGAEQGLWTWEIIRGIDRGEVAKKTAVKSMISSKNFKPSISTWEEASHWLKICSVELYSRLSEARQMTPGIWPKTIGLHFRSDAYVSRSRQAAFPFTSSFTSDYILRRAERLLKDFVAEKKGGGTVFPLCTNLAVQFQGLERQERGQKGIEGFLGQQSTAPAKRPRSASIDATIEPVASGVRTVEVSYDCPKCRKAITKEVAEHASTTAIQLLRAEHDDWHYARELMHSEKITVGSASVRPSKKPRATPGTLQSFFGKRTAKP